MYVFKFSKPSAGGLENFAKEDGVPPLTGVLVYFNFISFGDGTGWERPEGKTFYPEEAAIMAPLWREKGASLIDNFLRTPEPGCEGC